MTMCIKAEAVEKGDRVAFWVGSAPKAVRVREIKEGDSIRTFTVSLGGEFFEVIVQRGHTVDLLC